MFGRCRAGLGTIAGAAESCAVLGHDWPRPILPIDHVHAGPGRATVKVERGPNLGSDHYPLVITQAPVAPR